MFDQQTYIRRRAQLKKEVGQGLIILFGNNESPANGPFNGYHPFRQDSSFLYYFGQNRDGLVGVIDIDNDIETLIGDDIDIEDIVWFGSVDSVKDMAEQVGVKHSTPMKQLKTLCNAASAKYIFCRLTATTSSCIYTICWAFIPVSRKKAPHSTSSRLSLRCVPPRNRRRLKNWNARQRLAI